MIHIITTANTQKLYISLLMVKYDTNLNNSKYLKFFIKVNYIIICIDQKWCQIDRTNLIETVTTYGGTVDKNI